MEYVQQAPMTYAAPVTYAAPQPVTEYVQQAPIEDVQQVPVTYAAPETYAALQPDLNLGPWSHSMCNKKRACSIQNPFAHIKMDVSCCCHIFNLCESRLFWCLLLVHNY